MGTPSADVPAPALGTIRRMPSCQFSAHPRLNRSLDADPAAPLTNAEIRRLEVHLTECERRAGAVAGLRALWAMPGLSQRGGPQPEAVLRMRRLVDDLVEGRPR